MHSDDFRRAVQALAVAGVITWPQAYKAADDYHGQRLEVEREAEERAERYTKPKPFMRLMLIEDPILGIPVVFTAVFVWLLLSWLVF